MQFKNRSHTSVGPQGEGAGGGGNCASPMIFAFVCFVLSFVFVFICLSAQRKSCP